MKLIELLVQETLNGNFKWPEGIKYLEQYTDGSLFSGNSYESYYRYDRVDDFGKDEVTREQYEAALAAAQQPVWSGDGLPPVGCECEARMRVNTWEVIHVLAVTGEYLVGKIGETETVFRLEQSAFRPIRSEADKKRDEAIECLAYYVGKEDAADLYTAIAAGEVKGVKLDV